MKTINKTEDYLAKVALIQMGVKKFNDTVYSAPSATENKTHYLTVVEGQVTFCSDCKGFKFYGECAHGLAVLGYIEEEQRKAAEAAVAEVEDILSAEEATELQTLIDGPRAGVFASLDEMIASVHSEQEVAQAMRASITAMLGDYEMPAEALQASAWTELCQGNIQRARELECQAEDLLAKKASSNCRSCIQCGRRTLQRICGHCQLATANQSVVIEQVECKSGRRGYNTRQPLNMVNGIPMR